MPFSFKPLSLADVILVEPKIFPDERGMFLEKFKSSDFARAGLPDHFKQDNYSLSKKNVLRGLHFQKHPHAQGKLVSVIKGVIWDVVVDIRKDSGNFLQWTAVELDDKKHSMLYIPPGFAHGFLALSDEVHLLYKCTEEYHPQADAGICWNDPDIAIQWPVASPIVSDKDSRLPFIRQMELL